MLICSVVGYKWFIHGHKAVMSYGELEDHYLVSCRQFGHRYWMTPEPEDMLVEPD